MNLGPLHDKPLLGEIGLIALVPENWQSPWQSRHYVLSRLARYFNVVWCNQGYRWFQVWQRDALKAQGRHVESTPPLGLTVYQPQRSLPQLGRPRFMALWFMQQRLRRAQRILRNRGCRKVILCLWRPGFEPALNLIDHDLSCYFMDDEYTFSIVEQPIQEREERLISQVDQVFIHSHGLLEKKGTLNPWTTLVPNGVDYRAYATPQTEPEDLKPIPRPRIGYVGVIKKQLDLQLLLALAKRHQHWSFVFVGPQNRLGAQVTLVNELVRMPHVHFLGYKPVHQLPAYDQHMDVCMLCYATNDYTKFIYPLKLHEYLASGRPVVGSPLLSLQNFAHLIRLAQTPDEWSWALEASLNPDASSPGQVERRQEMARQHDWGKLVGGIAWTLCARLGPSYLEQFERVAPRPCDAAQLLRCER